MFPNKATRQGKASSRLGVISGECFQSLLQIESIESKLATILIVCVRNEVVQYNAIASRQWETWKEKGK